MDNERGGINLIIDPKSTSDFITTDDDVVGVYLKYNFHICNNADQCFASFKLKS